MKDHSHPPVSTPALARVAADFLDQFRNRLESELRHHERTASADADVANVELSREEILLNARRFERVENFLREVAEGRV